MNRKQVLTVTIIAIIVVAIAVLASFDVPPFTYSMAAYIAIGALIGIGAARVIDATYRRRHR